MSSFYSPAPARSLLATAGLTAVLAAAPVITPAAAHPQRAIVPRPTFATADTPEITALGPTPTATAAKIFVARVDGGCLATTHYQATGYSLAEANRNAYSLCYRSTYCFWTCTLVATWNQ